MKRILLILITLVLAVSLFVGCGNTQDLPDMPHDNGRDFGKDDGMGFGGDFGMNDSPLNTPNTDLGGDSQSFGDDISEMGAYDGYFTEASGIEVKCVSGSDGCYTLSNGVLTFSNLTESSVYSLSGQFSGSIIIDIGDDYKLDLELCGLSLISGTDSPITILSGKKVSLTAKSGTHNYIYDDREAADSSDETTHAGTIFADADLEICGKGSLVLISENNNGIHTKKDLTVKNLSLMVMCQDNALKGNDSVTISDGTLTLIAVTGDGIKTTNTDISEKGKQRGIVTISGGTHTIYAACDGIDSAYDVIIDSDNTQLDIYTDKYSNYSGEVTAVSDDVYYIRFTTDSYLYSVKYYNSDDDYVWVNAEYHSKVSGGRQTYYYYSFPKLSGYSDMQFFIYSDEMQQGQDSNYLVASDYLTVNTQYDTFALSSRGNSLSYSWTNYTTTVDDRPGMGGFGGFGMNDGNTDKGDHSTKGIKAGSSIAINGGVISIKSYDDGLHANAETVLENGETSKGSVSVSSGTLTIYSNDDGIHADKSLCISGGSVSIVNSYEGLEGENVYISGGDISVIASDDGINGTATSGTAIEISGGEVYVYCSGDGLDSNSRTSYSGIVFSGGNTVVISTSGGDSAIDTEQGYSYEGGRVLAIMPSRGMTNEVSHCKNFSSVASSVTSNLSTGDYLTVTVDNSEVVTVKMPTALSAKVVYLGDKSASISTAQSSEKSLDSDGVNWNTK